MKHYQILPLALTCIFFHAIACTPGANLSSQNATRLKFNQPGSVSDSDVAYIADRAVAYLDSIHPLESTESNAFKRAQLLLNPLKSENELLTVRVYALQSPQSISFPNGDIRIFSGLMDALTDAQVQALFAHEAAHINLGHARSRLVTAARELSAISANTDPGTTPTLPLEAQIGLALKETPYTQEEERQADTYALSVLAKNDLPLEALEDALSTLANFEAVDIRNFMHIGLSERISTLKAEATAFKKMLTGSTSQSLVTTSASQALLEQAEREAANMERKNEIELDPCSESVVAKAYPDKRAGWYLLSQPFSNKFDAELQTIDIPSIASDFTIIALGKTRKSFHILVGPFYRRAFAETNYQEFLKNTIITSESCIIHIKGKSPKPAAIPAQG